jgi:hypothetical protein
VSKSLITEATRRQLDDAVDRLRDLLPPEWTASITRRTPDGGMVRISSERDASRLKFLTFERLDPRQASGLPRPEEPTVATSRWISPRTRDLLRSAGLSYLDSTGNAEIRLVAPGLYVRTDGAGRDPLPKTGVVPGLRGPKAWALLRTLIEVEPPYGVRELSEALDLDAGYVSRILKVLDDERLITRRSRGPVTSCDWEGILRQLVSSYSLLTASNWSRWVAAGGPQQFLDDLAEKPAGQWAITGSFASSVFVPVAAPEMAFVYTADPELLARLGRLLPASVGANVFLASPYNEVVFDATRSLAGATFVSVAQTVADDLTGPGRMPEEGEALIGWMQRNVRQWRAPIWAHRSRRRTDG